MKLLTSVTSLLLPAGVLLTNVGPVLSAQEVVTPIPPPLSLFTPTTVLPDYSAADVARHPSPDNCWVTVSDAVYDLTTYSPVSAADALVAQQCGHDITAAVARPNLPLAQSLPRYQIGRLTHSSSTGSNYTGVYHPAPTY